MSFTTLIREISMIIAFLSTVTVGVYVVINRKDPDKRAKAMKGILTIGVSLFLVMFATSISSMLNSATLELTSDNMITGSQSSDLTYGNTNSTLVPLEVGYAEKTAISILNYFVDGLKQLRGHLLGEDISLASLLMNAKGFPLVDMNMKLSKGIGRTVNLYTLVVTAVLSFTSIVMYKTAFSGMKMAYDENEEAVFRDQLLKWGQLIILIAFAPAIMPALGKMIEVSMMPLRAVKDIISYNEIFNMTEEYFGLIIPAIKMYIMYIEFKIWILLLTRVVFINGCYLGTPIAVLLWAISTKFRGAEVLLSTLLSHLFMPMMYMISLAVTAVVIRAVGADNVFVVIVILGTVFSLSEMFLSFFHIVPNLKNSTGNLAGLMAGALMVMTMIKSSNNISSAMNSSSSGTTNNSGVIGGARSHLSSMISKGASSTAQSIKQSVSSVIGVSKGLSGSSGAASKVGSAIKTVASAGSKVGGTAKNIASIGSKIGGTAGKVLSSGVVKTSAGLAAAVAATAVTGNPLAGAGAFKGVSALTGAVGNGASRVSRMGSRNKDMPSTDTSKTSDEKSSSSEPSRSARGGLQRNNNMQSSAKTPLTTLNKARHYPGGKRGRSNTDVKSHSRR